MATLASLPSGLSSQLSALSRRIGWLRAVRRFCLTLVILVLTGSACILPDFFFGLPAWSRAVLLCGWLGLAGAATFLGLFSIFRRRPNPEGLAAVIEEKYPDLGERLTSVVRLADVQDIFHGSPALIALLTQETETRAGRLDFLKAISTRDTVRFSGFALAVVLLALSPAVLWPRHALELGRRFFLPWRTPGEMVFYHVEVSPGDSVAARGRPLALSARIVLEMDHVTPPGSCYLVLVDPEGQESRFRMVAERPDEFSFQMAKVPGDFGYRMEAGGARSPIYHVTAIEPVELAADSPTITLTPPPYAKRSIEEQTVHGLADLSALQHSRIRFDFRFTRPAVSAFLEWSEPANPNGLARATMKRLDLTPDGRGARCAVSALMDSNHRLILEAEHGVRTELEPRNLTVKLDQPPTFQKVVVGGSAPSNQAGAEESRRVLAYDSVPIEVLLADDIGVERLELEYRIQDGPSQFESLPLEGAGSQQASSRYSFKLADKALEEGDVLRYRFKAADNRRVPEADLEPQVVYYPPDQRWLRLTIVRQAEPLRLQEIAAERSDLDRRLDAIKRDLQKEQRGLYKLRREDRAPAALNPEQAGQLRQLSEDNQTTQDALRDLARTAAQSPDLQPLAEPARQVAEREMERSSQALADAAKTIQPEPRERRFQEADRELTAALRRVEEMERRQQRLAQERLDRANLELLADRQDRLAERAAQRAAADPIKDATVGQQTEKLRQEQNELSSNLKRLAEQSEAIRKSLDAGSALKARQLAAQARQLAQNERKLTQAGPPQQQAEQPKLQRQTADLEKDLRQLAQRMQRSSAAQSSAQRAAESSRQAQAGMQQAQERGRQGNPEQANQARQQSAQNLDQAARQAEAAAQQLTASLNAPGGQPPNAAAGQALQQAEAGMQQAQSKLAQSQHQAAQAAMKQAAQGLQQATRQLAPQAGRPSVASIRPNSGQPTEGGKIDPAILGGDAKKYAGKRWGELPGELRTRIVQDMQAKYGEDYARIIKLYFEQIADTKK